MSTSGNRAGDPDSAPDLPRDPDLSAPRPGPLTSPPRKAGDRGWTGCLPREGEPTASTHGGGDGHVDHDNHGILSGRVTE